MRAFDPLPPEAKQRHAFTVDGDAAVIAIAGGECRVSLADLPLVIPYRWSVGSWGYAAANRRRTGSSSCGSISMHWLVLGAAAPGMRVDHIDGDRLNNSRSNLRLVTRAENAQNVGVRRGSMRNVYPTKSGWFVRVKRDGQMIYGGHFMNLPAAITAARELRSVILPFTNEARHA